MKDYLNKATMANQIALLCNRAELGLAHIELAADDIANRMFPYAYACINKKKKFTLEESASIIATIVSTNHVAFKPLWSLLAMFAHENMINMFVDHECMYDRDGEKNLAMASAYDAAMHYQDTKSSPTNYIAIAVLNNIKRSKRESHPIHIPDKLAKAMAVIDDCLEEATALHGYEVWVVDIKELMAVLKARNVDISEKTAHDLMWARVADKSLKMTCGGANFPDSDEDPYFLINNVSNDSDNIENQINYNYEEILENIVAELFGEDTAFIAHMMHSNNTMEKMSFYKLEDIFRRYAVVKKHAEKIASCNPEAAEHIDAIKTELRRGGEEYAINMLTGTPAVQYLNAAIAEANADYERVSRGEIAINDLVGVVAAGSLNYKYSLAFPKKVPLGSAAEKHKEFRRRLCKNGLDFIVTGFDERFRNK